MDPSTLVRDALEDSARVKLALRELTPRIVATATEMAERLRAGGRVYACGNGGSACDAMHLVEELVARYKRDRPAIAAHHLLDAATLTCWSNDFDFEGVFARQVEAFVGPADVLVAISTSGGSPNVLRAAEAGRARDAYVVGLTGGDGGALATLASAALVVPARATERIQEAHITIIHLWCELIERALFPAPSNP